MSHSTSVQDLLQAEASDSCRSPPNFCPLTCHLAPTLFGGRAYMRETMQARCHRQEEPGSRIALSASPSCSGEDRPGGPA